MLHQLSTGFDLYIAESRSRLGNGDIRDPNPGPAEDLKAMEESPKKSMPISLKRMDELVAWYLVCVTLAQQTTHAPTQKLVKIHNQTKPNQTDPRHVGTPEGAAASRGDQNGGYEFVMAIVRGRASHSAPDAPLTSGKGGRSSFFLTTICSSMGQAPGFQSGQGPRTHMRGPVSVPASHCLHEVVPS
jgi:hypothetical protein